MFIISIQYKKDFDVDELIEYMPAHQNFITHAFSQSYWTLYGKKKPYTGEILISPIHDKQLLEGLLIKDPFYQAGVGKFYITEFEMICTSTNWEKDILEASRDTVH